MVLTISNRCRVAVNQRLNAIHAPADAILATYEGNGACAQSMRLWPGIVLQASVTEKRGGYNIKNALRYRVRAITQEVTELVGIEDCGAETGEPFTMPTPLVPYKLRPTYAITYDSSQALTLYGKIRLTQTGHPHMSLRRLIVGLGRAPEGCDVKVE